MKRKVNWGRVTWWILWGVVVAGIATAVLLWFTREEKQLASPAPDVCTTYSGTVEEQCAKDYIGLTTAEATARAKQFVMWVGFITIDGAPQANIEPGGTWIYFTIENDRVVGVCFDRGWEGRLCYSEATERERVALPDFVLEHECREMAEGVAGASDAVRYDELEAVRAALYVVMGENPGVDRFVSTGITTDYDTHKLSVDIPAPGEWLSEGHMRVLEEVRDKYLDRACFGIREEWK